jgi:hypothetical protein
VYVDPDHRVLIRYAVDPDMPTHTSELYLDLQNRSNILLNDRNKVSSLTSLCLSVGNNILTCIPAAVTSWALAQPRCALAPNMYLSLCMIMTMSIL